jgi:hypothetical protein
MAVWRIRPRLIAKGTVVTGIRARVRSIASITLAATVAASFTLAMPVPAQAQGLFDFLGSIFRGSAPRAYNREPPRLLDGFPGEDYDELPPRSSGGPRMAYCVRTCDGRFFPLPADAGRPSMTPAQVCSAMCPSAKTELYYGSEIDHAATQRGRPYTKAENAFLYRDRLVENCTCTGTDTAGVARIDLQSDPTLRPGDIVVTAEGPKVFTGNRQTPHKTSDFVPADEQKRLARSVREQFSEMRVAPEYGPANVKSGSAPAVSIGAAANPALAATEEEAADPTASQN